MRETSAQSSLISTFASRFAEYSIPMWGKGLATECQVLGLHVDGVVGDGIAALGEIADIAASER